MEDCVGWKMRRGCKFCTAKGTRTFHEAFLSSSLLVIASERCMLAPLKEERVSHSLRETASHGLWQLNVYHGSNQPHLGGSKRHCNALVGGFSAPLILAEIVWPQNEQIILVRSHMLMPFIWFFPENQCPWRCRLSILWSFPSLVRPLCVTYAF